MASRMPSPFRASSVSRVVSASSTMLDSVISRTSDAGSAPVAARMAAMPSTRSGSRNSPGREVGAHRQRRLVGHPRLPGAELAARLRDDPPTHRDDEPGLLRDRDELGRREQPTARMVPPDERLEAEGPARAEVDDRLVVEDELAALERPPQVGLELESGDRGGMHRRLEDLVAAAVDALRGVHRDVGVAQQLGRADGIGIGDGDPDAGPDDELRPVDDHRLGERSSRCARRPPWRRRRRSTSSSSTANSSPPRRATVSPGLGVARSRSATSWRTRSPAS